MKNHIFSENINRQFDNIFAEFDMTQSRYKYFAVSERDKRWGLYVLNCGESNIAAHEEFPPRNHPSHHYFQWQHGRILQEYQLFYLVTGAGIFESKLTGEREVSAGDAVLLFPGVWHRYKPSSDSFWHTYWVGFDGAFIRHIEEHRFFTTEQPIVHIGYQESVVRFCTEILTLGNDEFAGYQQAMAGCVIKMLADIVAIRHRGQFQYSNQEKMIQRARVLLSESIGQHILATDIARELGLGYSCFRRLFKEYTGLAPGQYLIQLRIENAKNLLSDPDRPIKQIAIDLGFESVHYFSRIFKEKTGLTPTSFRRSAS